VIPFEDVPLWALLGKPHHECSPDEQRALVAHLRACRTSPPTFAKAVKEKPPSKPKSTKTQTVKSEEALKNEYGI
jgi:hypothetical protein